ALLSVRPLKVPTPPVTATAVVPPKVELPGLLSRDSVTVEELSKVTRLPKTSSTSTDAPKPTPAVALPGAAENVRWSAVFAATLKEADVTVGLPAAASVASRA